MNVVEIEIRGKKMPVLMSLGAYKEFFNITGIDFLKGFDMTKMSLEQVIALFYSGLKGGAFYNDKEFPYTMEQVSFWLTAEDLIKVQQMFKLPEPGNEKPNPIKAKK